MGSDAKERLLSMNPWVDLDWPERCKQAAARIAELEAALSAATARAEAAEAEAARLREALTPSGDTKAAYSGEIITEVRCRIFATGEVLKEDLQLPWVTIKDVMRMIARRAALGSRT